MNPGERPERGRIPRRGRGTKPRGRPRPAWRKGPSASASGARSAEGARSAPGSRSEPGARSPLRPAVDPEAIELALLDAARRFDEGDDDLALAAAGEAVYLDPRRPAGYLLIGEIHFARDDVPDALEAFTVARRKAAHWPPDPDAEIVPLVLAEAGRARCLRVLGRLEEAAGAYRAALAADPDDPLSLGTESAETMLLLGHFEVAARTLGGDLRLGPDGLLVQSLAHGVAGRLPEASRCFRAALLRNPYLVAALLEEDPPEFELAHGEIEGTPEFAVEVANRLRLFLADHPDLVESLVDIATTPTVREEVERFVEVALELNTEAAPERRAALSAELDALRAEARLVDTTARVLAEAAASRDDGDGDGDPCASETFRV